MKSTRFALHLHLKSFLLLAFTPHATLLCIPAVKRTWGRRRAHKPKAAYAESFLIPRTSVKYSESTKFTKATKVGRGHMKAIFVFFVSFVDREI